MGAELRASRPLAGEAPGGPAAPSAHPAVELKGIEKRFLTQVAVHPLDLSIAPGEFLTLLGPSGCGKTTLLRMIAGLELPSAGSVSVFGEDVTDRPPNKRPLNLVFQKATLFPHLSVAENIGFGPKLRRADRREVAAKVESLLELVDLAGYGPRRVNELSGGQAQRVALVRALANDPKVLLLDEPLSALDLAIRRQLQRELKDIHRRLGMTFIYVTHDQEEALSMSDRVAVMRDGRIQQLGSPVEIYRNPCSPFVARFLGLVNVIDAVVKDVVADGLVLDAAGLTVRTGRSADAGSVQAGDKVSIVVRPDCIDLSPLRGAGATGANRVEGIVADVRFAGSVVHYGVSTPGRDWQVSVPANHAGDLVAGDAVELTFGEAGCVVMAESPKQPA
ncbi:MAG: potG [Acidimicrobiaceae bacterium]|nr:potG [Acidimicrobiaceae bacterium]